LSDHSRFATTQWTLVWEAAKEDSQHGRPALAEVVRRYWQPLYLFARNQGLPSQDAEDATQEFLSGVMEGRLLEKADPAKGRFRTFLLVAWKRFLIDEFRKANTQRRGGGVQQVPLDVGTGEQNWLAVQSQEPDGERVFMRSWANSLLYESRERLRREYYSRGKSELFESLLPKLTTTIDGEEYQILADRLKLSVGAVKVALHRLRQKFGQTLRDVVAETVDESTDIDQELSDLLSVLKG
jgi:RNA polymerase sigma factor (sigma-70 family)